MTTLDHPRLRGEHQVASMMSSSRDGSPPPARGAPNNAWRMLVPNGITPACAGSTGAAEGTVVEIADHPRLRGEHVAERPLELDSLGSPPPARGAPARSCRCWCRSRITP